MLTFQTSSSRLCGRLPDSGPVEPWQGQCLAVMVLLWDSVERKFWVSPPAGWSSVTRLSGSSYPSPSSESSLLLLDVAILPLPALYLKKVEVISNSIWHPIRIWFLHTSNNSHLGIPLLSEAMLHSPKFSCRNLERNSFWGDDFYAKSWLLQFVLMIDPKTVDLQKDSNRSNVVHLDSRLNFEGFSL